MVAGLARLGLTPDDIDLVIDTHLHGDHCGGNTTYAEDGSVIPVFPNAEYVVQRREYEDASQPNERTRATYLAENFEPLVESGQMRLLDGDTALALGVRGVVTPGHTPGHMSILLESKGQHAAFVCDLASYALHFERFGLDDRLRRRAADHAGDETEMARMGAEEQRAADLPARSACARWVGWSRAKTASAASNQSRKPTPELSMRTAFQKSQLTEDYNKRIDHSGIAPMPRIFIILPSSFDTINRSRDASTNDWWRRLAMLTSSKMSTTSRSARELREVLEREIAKCDVLLAIIGQQWASIPTVGRAAHSCVNDFVRIEVETGVRRDDLA